MYCPPQFREDRLAVMHALMRAHPLGLLITSGAGGLMANHLPFLIDESVSGKGILRGHLAKANDQLQALQDGAEALVVFAGPQAYVSPSWYPSKAEHGKVVPTWNYVTVHAWGKPCIVEHAVWLRRQLTDLTDAQEQDKPEPWAVTDAPEPFIASMSQAIVGLEIPITRIEGKWKVSQNRSQNDRRGVVDGLRRDGAQNEAMVALVAAKTGRSMASRMSPSRIS